MEAFLVYLVKVAILTAVFCILYRLLLSRLTFHGFNRVVLICVSLLAFVLPLIHLPDRGWFPYTWNYGKELNGFLLAELIRRDFVKKVDIICALAAMLLFCWLYAAGFLVLLVRKVLSVSDVAKIIRDGRYATRREGCDVIESDSVMQPFNWMKFVVMPHEWLRAESAEVWRHESQHARKGHSLDLILADIICIVQWFNPFVILLRKDFELIHEFEADKAVIDSGVDADEYKLMLIKAVASNRKLSPASWLMQSGLKKRIDMMDAQPSAWLKRLRVLWMVAVSAVFLMGNSVQANVAPKAGGRISGHIHDSKGKVIRTKVTVTERDIVRRGLHFTSMDNADGYFELFQIDDPSDSLFIEADGYRTLILPLDRSTYDITMVPIK